MYLIDNAYKHDEHNKRSNTLHATNKDCIDTTCSVGKNIVVAYPNECSYVLVK